MQGQLACPLVPIGTLKRVFCSMSLYLIPYSFFIINLLQRYSHSADLANQGSENQSTLFEASE